MSKSCVHCHRFNSWVQKADLRRGKRAKHLLAQVLNVEMFCRYKEKMSAVRISVVIKFSHLLKCLGLETTIIWKFGVVSCIIIMP